MQVKADDGRTCHSVTPPVLTAWSRVTHIQASHSDPATAYASVDRDQLQDFEPYIYRTRDLGKTWEPITTHLPRGVYVYEVRVDPARRGLLLARTARVASCSAPATISDNSLVIAACRVLL